MNKLIDSLQIVRRELLIMDEPIKALNLLRLFNLPELKADEDKTYAMVRHIYDPEFYKKIYGNAGEDQIPDCEDMEPRKLITDARGRYMRYDWMIAEMDALKPKSYLDLACYIGSLVTTASYKGIKAYGVDMTKKAIEVAAERALSAGLSCEFFCDDATTFNKVKADLVSAFEVIEHVVDPVAFINHLKTLANEWVYITTPNGSFDNGQGNLGHWDWDGVDEHVRGHVRAFTKESMYRLLKDNDCEIGFLEAMPDNLVWAKFRKAKK